VVPEARPAPTPDPPSDREVFAEIAALTTESINPRTVDLDRRPLREVLALINDEDEKVPRAVRREIDAIARAVELVVERMRRGGRLIYVGAGTSGRLGVLDAAECPPTFGTDPALVRGVMAGGPPALMRAVEGAEDDGEAARTALVAEAVTAADVVVGIAASRRTPFVVAALRYAREVGAGTVLVTTNALPAGSGPGTPGSSPGGPLGAASVDVAICPEVGPEVIMGSTRMKSGTAQKLVLNMISTATMVELGKVYGNLMVDLGSTSRKLTERAKRLVMMTTAVDYDRAAALLAEAGGRVKVAILIGKLHIDRAAAESRLAAAGGRVREALGEHSG
jgi:N-acetylmuramic acid 6-phosphate etherase